MMETNREIEFVVLDRQPHFFLVELRLGGHPIATASYYQRSDARWRYEWQSQTFDTQRLWAIAALQQIIKTHGK